MHRLSYGFILGYHGCDQDVGESLLVGADFKQSENDYDWLGPGVYFWEANPLRGREFAGESMHRPNSKIKVPFVIGAVVDLGRCLDLTTSFGIQAVKRGFDSLRRQRDEAEMPMPVNTADRLRRKLDCAVIRRVNAIWDETGLAAFDTVRGVFTEGQPAYPGAGFNEKTHIQIAVRNLECIKGVFRVPDHHLAAMAP